MRILVNDIAASTGGALTILKEFYEYVKENDIENEWIFLIGDDYLKDTEKIKVIVRKDIKKSWLKRLKFDYISGRKLINNLKVDRVISLQNTAIFGLKIPQILYIHQSIPFQKSKKFSFFKSKERILAIYQYIIGWFIKKSICVSDKVIVQTKWMKKEIEKYSNLDKTKVVTILPDIKIKDINDSKIKIKDNLFFYPASNEIYKNHNCIFNACKILNDKGINNFKVILTINPEELDRNSSNIYAMGNLNINNVYDIYKKSILIFPSYIETVGLPLLESRKVGTIILASDCEFSKEVLYGYKNVCYFDPFNPMELAYLMESFIKEKKPLVLEREELIIKNSGWKMCLKEIIE
ncbi:glycosyltransferase involved in cell wall biosynthesis [Clostridium moniliforme]|uniref:Glycosyltransferase involved in cell wall biosynthesis n=1 Tax=Clostridium moniliforme TaxID=39489 RepID=A0ABS4EYU5_9CLOT|nr:glycosyltransferase [Clostridium moniliforme]MBP1889169.1 glycosyltransferase involved in cell wall biosynthesis [Clostridium moniliforme]